MQNAVATAVAHASGQQYCECVCPANAPWRCDCSGLVSRAWGLGSPGLTTCGARLNLCLRLNTSCCTQRTLAISRFQSRFSVIAAPSELLLQLRFQPRRVRPPGLAGRTAAGRHFAVARRRSLHLPALIFCNSLWPGDPSAHTGHVVMFVKWIEEGKSYIEAACHE